MSGLTTLALREQTTYQRDEIDSLKARVRLLETQEIPFVSRLRIDAKGDLFAGTADNAYARLAVGANGDLLIADSTQTTGLRWGAATAAVISDFVEAAQDAVGGALTDSSTIDFTYNDGANTITAIVIDNSISNAKLRQGAALSVIGRSANSTGNVDDIAAGTDGHVLRRSGTSLGFGTVATAGIADAAITDAKLRNSAALSVIGRSANSSGAPADIAAGTDGHVLRRSGTSLGFGTVATAGIADDAITTAKILDGNVTNAKLANMNQGLVKGRGLAAGTGAPEDLSAASVNAIVGTAGLPMSAAITWSGALDTFQSSALGMIYGSAATGVSYPFLEAGNVVFQARSTPGALRDIIFTANGTTPAITMVIARTGRVGIGGVTSPSRPLHVSGDGQLDGALALNNSTNALPSTTIPLLYSSSATGAAYPFLESGNLVVQSRDSGANRDIAFFAGGSLAAVISRNQRLGIGTSDPFHLIHVGAGSATLSTAGAAIVIQRNADSAFVARHTGGSTEIFMEADSAAGSIGMATNHALRIMTNGQNRIRVTAAGNVGIVSTNPLHLLHVGGGSDTLVTTGPTITTQIAGITAIVTRNTSADVEAFLQSANTDGRVGTATNHSLLFRSNNITRMTLQAGGNLAIGGGGASSLLSVQAGTSSDHANVGGIIYSEVGSVTTGSGTDQDLMTFSVPANTLATNGESVWFEATGRMNNVGASKTIRAYFGSTVLLVSGISSSLSSGFVFRGRIIRSGAATQVGSAELITIASIADDSAPAETLSSAVTLRITCSSSNASAITLTSLIVGYDPVNT